MAKKALTFTKLFQNACARVVTLQTMMALVATGKKFEGFQFHPEVQSLGIFFMANVGPNTNSSQFFIPLPRWHGWMASMQPLGA
jgi:cyclophilin family peptidyl-prolyl cis-trans isomerase